MMLCSSAFAVQAGYQEPGNARILQGYWEIPANVRIVQAVDIVGSGKENTVITNTVEGACYFLLKDLALLSRDNRFDYCNSTAVLESVYANFLQAGSIRVKDSEINVLIPTAPDAGPFLPIITNSKIGTIILNYGAQVKLVNCYDWNFDPYPNQ